MSHIPTVRQLTLISDSSFEYEEPTSVRMLCIDSKGDLYTTSGKNIYKLNNIGDYELVLETGDFYFNSFAFDKSDNIWLSNCYEIT